MRVVRVLSGTSGFSYKEWKGSFYPPGLPARAMLAYYAERLPTVEINHTFYRLPEPRTVARWAEQAPEGFVFAVKASRRITHKARLGDEALETLARLHETLEALGPHRGPVLAQLPPWFRKDVGRLRAFLEGTPAGLRLAFEFRHESWDDETVRALLAEHEASWCVADTGGDDHEPAPIVATASWGYLRLRRTRYGHHDLARWAEWIRAQPWKEVFVYFKHEDESRAPRLAQRLAELLAAA